MGESQGLPGERIVEWNLSYRLGTCPGGCAPITHLSAPLVQLAFLEGNARTAQALPHVRS